MCECSCSLPPTLHLQLVSESDAEQTRHCYLVEVKCRRSEHFHNGGSDGTFHVSADLSRIIFGEIKYVRFCARKE